MKSIINNFSSLGCLLKENAACEFIIKDFSNPTCAAVHNPHQELFQRPFSAMPSFPSTPTILTDLFDYFSLFIYHFSLNQTLTATVSQIR